jgi:hypothetical protein
MDTIRRKFLGGLALALPAVTAAAAASTAPAIAEEPPFDLQHWLDTADRNAVAQYHAARLAEVMGTIDTRRHYRSTVDYKNGFVLVVGDPNPVTVARQE